MLSPRPTALVPVITVVNLIPGIRIDYAASKDGSHQKMSCHKSLQPVQKKYRVWDSGRSPNELMQGMILVVREIWVAIVCE
ncbi:hypothetical protein PIB30_016964 [Stylosanthes scabra]|uniref:Uncharacterized protein n=1 Tax=Stylosanthes scabra TaxID=79078 RepID=A0ABU6Y866_9FABA|nr:hypothetical protein [Stylosanthes scabra]